MFIPKFFIQFVIKHTFFVKQNACPGILVSVAKIKASIDELIIKT